VLINGGMGVTANQLREEKDELWMGDREIER